MRTMLLSFKPNVFERVMSGEKIYEHRRTFPNETIKAYLYVSRPVQAITGIMILGNRTNLAEWKEKYSQDDATAERITRYMNKNRFVMEIQQFQPTNAILLSKIQEDIPEFIIPQMYMYLDNTKLLEHLEKNIESVGKKITHSFEDVTSAMICIN